MREVTITPEDGEKPTKTETGETFRKRTPDGDVAKQPSSIQQYENKAFRVDSAEGEGQLGETGKATEAKCNGPEKPHTVNYIAVKKGNGNTGDLPSYSEAYSEIDDTTDTMKITMEMRKNEEYDKIQNGHPATKTDDESDDDEDEDEVEKGCFGRTVMRIQSNMSYFWEHHGTLVKYLTASFFVLLYAVYFGYAMSYEFGSESSVRLLWMTLFGVFLVLVTVVMDNYGDDIYDHVNVPVVTFVEKRYTVFKVVFLVGVVVGLIVFLVVEVAMKYPYNMISFMGYIVFLSLLFIFSHNPSKVYWRQVLWGIGLQFVFALLVLRTTWGYATFKWLGDRIQEFMAYTDSGSIFVFGESYEDHFFAMKVMPVVIFLSCVISVLYYLGIMQVVILKLAWIMQRTMSTSAAESVNAAGNIFIGQTEAPLLIRPMMDRMTNSELHAVMVGGFATIAGSVLATYILFGVPANHLVTASVMAAPCALGMSKLSYPDRKKRKAGAKHDVAVMDVPPYANVIEAASAGASAAIPLVANILVNIIAFIALVEFFNTTLTWMGHRVGLWPPEYPELTFEFLCSYLLWPFAFLMGVAQEDCRQVAELIGIKTFVNEMVAYTELGVLIDNSETFNEYNGTWVQINDDIYLVDTNTTLYGGVLEDRSIVIATYALCGFANVASIGTVMGALGGMAPSRAQAISGMAVRAMITGTVVSFMNACVAGLLYNPEIA